MTSGGTKDFTVGRAYKWLLISVVLLCFGCLIAGIILAGFWKQPTDQQKHAFDLLDWGFKSTLGAFLGLVGGKATS